MKNIIKKGYPLNMGMTGAKRVIPQSLSLRHLHPLSLGIHTYKLVVHFVSPYQVLIDSLGVAILRLREQ